MTTGAPPDGNGSVESAPPENLGYAWYVVAVLMLAYMVAFVDRQILSLLVEPIKRDLDVTDTQIGWLAGFAFAVFYSILGVPIARLADRTNRCALISIGVVLWSIMTAACGLTKTYWQLFLMRVGVGVGEATLSPAAYSLISDYFPPNKIAKAVGVYAMGLYMGAGVALLTGSAVVGLVSDAGNVTLPLVGEVRAWQLTFFIVALPGMLVLALMATVREPVRREFLPDGSSVATAVQRVPLSEIAAFFRYNSRIMIAHFGGFLALGTVISAYLIWVPEFLRRSHGFSIAEAGFIYGLALLVLGGAAPYAGGWFAEWLGRRGHRDAEMRAAFIGGLAMIPLTILAPLVPGKVAAVVMLGLVTFALAFPQGLAPTILAVVAPNRMRAQVTALFILLGVLAGFSLGPAFVAIVTDSVFRDDADLRYSLAIVSAVLTPVGVAFLYYGLKPFRERKAFDPVAAAIGTS